MLDDVIEQLGFDKNDITINNIVASQKSNSVTGDLCVNKIINITELKNIEKHIADALKMNVKFNIRFLCYDDFSQGEYSDFVSDYLFYLFGDLSVETVKKTENAYAVSLYESDDEYIMSKKWVKEFFTETEKTFGQGIVVEADFLKRPAVKKAEKKKKTDDVKEEKNPLIYGKSTKTKAVAVSDLTFGKTKVVGEIFGVNVKPIPKKGKTILKFGIKDKTGAVNAKIFTDTAVVESGKLDKKLNGLYAGVYGNYATDNFTGQNVFSVSGIEEEQSANVRTDTCECGKRVELHLHTQMSSMDGIIDIDELINQAERFGHKAFAITDHGVVQNFPKAYFSTKDKDIKVIYGVEGYLLDDDNQFIFKCNDGNLTDDVVVFDIETTGLDYLKEKITEIGAVKISNGKITAVFHSMVNPEKRIPPKIVEITGITNDMVADAPLIDKVLDDFYEFCKGCNLSAHNASFDTGFIYHFDKENRFTMPVIDTLALSRVLLPNLKNHKLDTLTKHFNILLSNHHRADHDAKATGELLLKLLEMFSEKGVKTLRETNEYCFANGGGVAGNTYHVILLAQNTTGLKNIYKMVTESHLKYFYKKPRIPKSLLAQCREGVLVGSACEQGEVYKSIINKKTKGETKKLAEFYDYLEIQPISNNSFLVNNGKVDSVDTLRKINQYIYDLGKELGKTIVATCDAHFLNKEDRIFRQIILAGQGYKDTDNDSQLYFRTTDEMLAEFGYLGPEEAKEVVIDNTNKIADMCNVEKPFLDGKTYTPTIEGAEDEMTKLTYDRAYELYGSVLPDIVQKRIDKELNSINKYGYAVLYLIAQKLVTKSVADGYLVGSRGSVGSSFVAFLSGITEVNPLAPHYICKKCKASYFDVDADAYPCGKDLPDRVCDKCGEPLYKDGYDIPFEVFLGFKGDKVPDIDLNFSGEYQPKAHKYIEELFGEGNVFRAGTVSRLQSKTAYGFVKKYEEENGLTFTDAYRNWLVCGCEGVKRTTGQHPGGIVIVPKEYDVYDFTPLQHPADDKDKGVITTHFDFNSMHDILVKVDALGHDDPTMLRSLEDATGIKPVDIPLDDKETLSIFSSTTALGLKPEDIDCVVGTFGIPEFGTPFVIGVLKETMPKTTAELVRISGLSHGTDVWTNNAQELVKNKVCTLSEAICTRDDIMNYLIKVGVEPKIAFDVMEKVRKGKGKQLPEEHIKAMEEAKVADWYLDSCRKIGYMFPKAHAAAYVMMAFRIAWFKVHKPEYYYAAYFSRNVDDFKCTMIDGGADYIRIRIEEINKMSNPSVNEKNELILLEVLLEMMMRGYKMLPVDLEKSQANKFVVENGNVRMPFRAIAGLGDAVADAIVEEREIRPFLSVEDLKKRTKLNGKTAEFMDKNGFLNGISKTNQLSFF